MLFLFFGEVGEDTFWICELFLIPLSHNLNVEMISYFTYKVVP